MPSVTITWHTTGSNVCPICQQLENHSWTFPIGEGALPNELSDPRFGVVWDISSGSEVHHKNKGLYGECKCVISAVFDLHDILVKLQAFYERILIERGGEASAQAT